jgi:hypothetical protein
MLIKDIDFTKYEQVSKKCIYFGKDGNSVTKRNKKLYSLAAITKLEQHKNLYVEVVPDEYNTNFYVWDDLEVIAVNHGSIIEHWSLEEMTSKLATFEYFGKDGYIKSIYDSMNLGYYINLLNIETCLLLGKDTLAKECIQYRLEYIKKREDKEKAKQEKREREEQAELTAMKKLITDAEDETEQAIIKKETFYNNEVEGKSIILRLMKKYGINLPLKTQGWVNKALAKISFYPDGRITYHYYTSSKNSTVFMGYLEELQEKILENV